MVTLKEIQQLSIVVCTTDDSVPGPYIICKEKPGYSVAFYSKRLGLSAAGNASIYSYRKLSHDGLVAVFKNRQEAINQGNYRMGF